MPLEAGNYINDLNQSNPVGSTDQVSTLDNHIQLIKKILRQSFSDIGAEVSASAGDLNQWSKVVVSGYWLSLLTEATATANLNVAPIDSPQFTGTPKVPTATLSSSSSQIVNTILLRRELSSVHDFRIDDQLTALTEKTAVHNDDVILIEDSEASGAKKKAKKTNIAKQSYACIQDRKAATVAGGSATSGSWEKRDLNTVVDDADSIVSVASDQITLQAGTYRIRASAPAYLVVHHQIQLYNATDTAVQQSTEGEDLLGTKEYCGSLFNVQSRSILTGRFTITGAKAFEIRHQVSSNQATTGYGVACSWGVAVFSEVEIWKE